MRFTTFHFRCSHEEGRVPELKDIEKDEIAINCVDKILYYRIGDDIHKFDMNNLPENLSDLLMRGITLRML